ncbi:MAG: AI-2E family transporter [Clostridium sp.]
MRNYKKIIRYLFIINLALLAIVLIKKIEIIGEILNTVSIVIIFPFVFGVFLFYLLRPIRNSFIRVGLGKNIAAILTVIIFSILLSIVGKYYGEYFINQFVQIKKILLQYIEEYKVIEFINKGLGDFSFLGQGTKEITYFVSQGKEYANKSMTIFSGVMLSILIFYFLLKDGEKLVNKVLSAVASDDKEKVEGWLQKGDKRLSTYILGQAAVAFSLSLMMYIGYKIIGMGSPLLLSSITFILAFIPFIGFYISLLIPYFIAFIIGVEMMVKLTILVIVAQTLKGRLVVPFVMGRVMKIHPLTDISLVVLGATIGGPLIAFIIIPCYALAKTFFGERKEIIRVIKHSWRDKSKEYM